MSRNKISFILLFLSVLNLFPRIVTINIIDLDINIPLEGVKIINVTTGESSYSDSAGIAQIEVESQTVILAELIGYQRKKAVISEEMEKVNIELSMEFIIQGQELVIEGKAPGRTDEKVGVSKVVEKNEMKSTANSGPMQDVMSTIKTLPGVISAGKFNPNFSIRGGEPDDLTIVMDGFIVKNPWHWGGAFSIFNPNIVKTLKFSAGIFSAKYGPAGSGLMEVNTINPNDGVKLQTVISIMTAEVLLQTPIINEKSGLYIGGRLTSMDLPILMVKPLIDEQGINFVRAPYIYDGYLKWFAKPVEWFEIYANGFFGADGIGMVSSPPQQTAETHIVQSGDFRWYNYDAFGTLGIKLLPHDKVFIHLLGGYEFQRSEVNATFETKGKRTYTQKFKDYYNNLPIAFIKPLVNDYFTIDTDGGSFSSTTKHTAQGRADIDITITDKILLSIGGGALYSNDYFANNGNMWSIGFEKGLPVYEPISFSILGKERNIVESFGYLSMDFKIIPDIFQLEIGCRADHAYLFGEGYTLNTYPVPGPRLNIFLSPFKANKVFDSLTMSLGVGLFSKAPMELIAYEKSMGIKDFEMPIGKSLSVISGVEILFPFDIKVKTEGYFKYFFDRFYANMPNDESNVGKFKYHSDGYGYASGFDISIDRKMSKFLDGSLSYSFSYIRLFNPQTDGETETYNGRSTGKWFYPSYHRFNSMNLILNARPTDFLTITSKLSIASGKPQPTAGETNMFFAVDEKTGSIMELYAISYSYSDDLRTEISIPFDLKVTFNYFIPKTKAYLEFYIGVEDLFSPLYAPKSATQVDMFSGEEVRGNEASFNIGAPIPSLGFTLNF